MIPLKITYPITSKEIARLVRLERKGRVRQRLTALKFILQGQIIPFVAQRMDIAPRPLRKGLHRFNQEGPSGLSDRPRPAVLRVRFVKPIINGPLYLDPSVPPQAHVMVGVCPMPIPGV